MRIFVGEYVSGGGLADVPIDDVPKALHREGSAMLHALATDLAEFSDIVIATDARFSTESLEAISFDRIKLTPMDAGLPIWSQWLQAASDCDAALIIAPENDGLLAQAVAMLRAGGIDVIAGSGDFLRTASDKLLTAKALERAGVAHPLSMTLTSRKHERQLSSAERFVVKPRDGCGTQKILMFDSFDDAKAALEENQLLQAWMPGKACSIAMIASDNQRVFLPAVSQTFVDGTCEYAGGSGPLDDDAQRRLTNLAVRSIEAMPPMAKGFIGFDMLLGSRPSQDCVIEINPRMTTSYVGLRQMIHGNLAARLFDVETGPVTCCTSVDSVRWTPDGAVQIDDAAAELN